MGTDERWDLHKNRFFFLTRRATASLRRRKLFHADRPVKVQLHDMMRKLEVQIQSLLNSALYAG